MAPHLRLLEPRGVLLIRGEGAMQAGVQEDQALREHGALEGRVGQLQLGQLGRGQVLQVQVADATCRCRGTGASMKMISQEYEQVEPATPFVLGEGLALRPRWLFPAAWCGDSFLMEGLYRRPKPSWCRRVEGLAA